MDYDQLAEKLDLSSCRTICRLCLTTKGNMEDLFFNGNDELVENIFKCTSVKLTPANGIFSSVCSRCKRNLFELVKFREQCIRCEDIFQSKAEKLENETIEVVPDIFNIHSDDESCDGSISENNAKASESWNGIDVESAMDMNGGAFLCKAETEQEQTGDSEESSFYDSFVDRNGHEQQKAYTLTPPMDINLKSLVVYIKDKKHWQCPHCEKYFSQSGNLKAHINTHTGYKPYTCNLCNRSFAQKSNLNYHMKASHDPHRPFKCNACDKAFNTMDMMVSHLKKHQQPEGQPRTTGPKKHQCPYCGKGFTQSFNLKLHVNTHTGERPYKCNLCPKTFTQRSNLNVHVKKNHTANANT